LFLVATFTENHSLCECPLESASDLINYLVKTGRNHFMGTHLAVILRPPYVDAY